MDWKRLVQFALQGSSDLEQYAILLIRVSIGLFFAISGANKLFVAGGTKPVYDTLVKAKAPFPRQLAYFVAGVEFVCGSLLTVGFLSSAACVALLIDMTVATLTSAVSTLPKGLSPHNWLSRLRASGSACDDAGNCDRKAPVTRHFMSLIRRQPPINRVPDSHFR